jgi:hypothetical protein
MSTKNKVQLVILGLLLVLSVSSLIFFMNSDTTQCYDVTSAPAELVSLNQVTSKDAYSFLTKSQLSYQFFSAGEKLINISLVEITNSLNNSTSILNHPSKFCLFSFTPFVTMCFNYTL